MELVFLSVPMGTSRQPPMSCDSAHFILDHGALPSLEAWSDSPGLWSALSPRKSGVSNDNLMDLGTTTGGASVSLRLGSSHSAVMVL
jgi:hypothetical protein